MRIVVIEGEYRTGHQEQLYIETNGVIAVPGDGQMTVYGSLQCPYYVHKALVVLLNLPPDRVRVVQTETGGGFGGKEEYPSMLACHAAILARKAGRPVKMIYDRVEDLLATTKRHPSIVRHRTGLTRDGRLTAMDIDVIMDGGAYATLSAVVLSRGVIHAAGPVPLRSRPHSRPRDDDQHAAQRRVPRLRRAADAVRVEAHMDRIAEALGIDPVRLREINALKPGDTTATGQKLGKDASALPVLREAVKRSQFKQEAARSGRAPISGIGLSLFFHGSGFTGGGEVEAGVEGVARADRDRRAHPRRQHRDRPGHADDARADRGRCAGRAVRRDRRARGRHRVRARQRPDRGVAHLHDRRQAARALRARHAAAPRHADAGAVFHASTARSP